MPRQIHAGVLKKYAYTCEYLYMLFSKVVGSPVAACLVSPARHR